MRAHLALLRGARAMPCVDTAWRWAEQDAG